MTLGDSQKGVWIGLLEVFPLPGSCTLGNAAGAYTNALAWAADPSEFEAQVKHGLEDLGLCLGELEDVEPLDGRLSRYTIEDELHDLADEVRATRQTRFGTFHTFPGE